MTKQEFSTYSGERLSFFQLFSQKKLKVEIPIIQRDYAQGRKKQIIIRTAFLDALYGYLDEGKAHRDLDFVYGSVIVNEQQDAQITGQFIPLDGQQRLTTLFLLHWYLGQISSNGDVLRSALSINGHSRFTYETRSSSRDFCNALIANDLNFDNLCKDTNGTPCVSITIQDASWFYLSWNSDPTISAMLTMLDAIHHRFDGCTDFFDRLIDHDSSVITFLFLNLEEFKLTDDLYIKMNARGKPLTHFENFKARLEKKIKSFDNLFSEYSLNFRDEKVNAYDYFIHKIDTSWADIFWGYRNLVSKDNLYDDEMMNLIALVLANAHIIKQGVESKLFGLGGKLQTLSFAEYDSLGCLNKNNISDLITILDLLHNEGLEDGRIRPYIENNPYYQEESVFKKVISNTASYPEKLRFYAFYLALSRGVEDGELLSLMRVIFNLTENTIINALDEYCSALKSIRNLIIKDVPVLDLLKNDTEVTGFAKDQVMEERVKAHLITKSDEWASEVIKLEKAPYFSGQIGFILKFAGVITYYNENRKLDWNDSDQMFLSEFKRYSNLASSIFKLIKNSSESINYAWERAVLTKGKYFTKATANRFNLLSKRSAKNNIERDHSWKRLLRSLSFNDDWDKKQSYVKAVLDDPKLDSNDVAGSLETICFTSLKNPNVEEWKKMLIQKPELFNICNQGFIAIDDNEGEVLLLHESQRNHFHSELHSKYLEIELRNREINLKPFNEVNYYPEKGIEDSPSILLEGFAYKGRTYEVEIWFGGNKYYILFCEIEERTIYEELVIILEDNDFKSAPDEYYYENSYVATSATVEATLVLVDKLCLDLRRKLA